MTAKDKPPAPPKGLGDAGRSLWRSITTEVHDAGFELDGRECATLAAACRQADDIAALEAVIDRDGLVVLGAAGQPRLSAAVTEVRQGRLALAKMLGELALPDEDGVTRTQSQARAARAANARWDRFQGRRGVRGGTA
ncbi:MAG: hypothetical protein R2737_07890 [Candidatus Nanopelagicales bacterium]